MRSVPQKCRQSLQPRDWEFVERALAGQGMDPAGMAEETPGQLTGLSLGDVSDLDEFLDHPRLLEAILAWRGVVHLSPELYFYVLVRHGLREAGIEDRSIADYVAAILAEYSRGNPMLEVREGEALDFTYHVTFLDAMDEASAYDRFHLQVMCGNQFLVLTGLFPAFLEQRHERKGAPSLNYYEGVARQAFLGAGRHPLAEEFDLDAVYRHLSERFPETRRALNHLASEYLFLGA